MKKIKRALISVSDKKKLKPLLETLKKNKVEIISSGGTYKEIRRLKHKSIEISQYTGSPEILSGRVKTLHPKIHAGILNKRSEKSHYNDLIKNNFKNIDLVIVNFYPFEEILKKKLNPEKMIDYIDVGGPAMVRAAAKNYEDVIVITSSSQYDELINEIIKFKGSSSINFRQRMSQVAFSETAYYDCVISNYFGKLTNNNFPRKKIIFGNLIEELRYGENPHQKSALYSQNDNLNIKQLHGKKLSYNNYNDIFTALTISKSLPGNSGTVIVKHANPCGVSALKDKVKSYKSALACDPISAFGGTVSCNFKISKKLALEINKLFIEIIVANDFDSEALKILKRKKNLRIIDSSKFFISEVFKFNSANNNFLVQTVDKKEFKKSDFQIVSNKKPSKKQFDDLIFAFNVCRFVKSNAIVLASNKTTIGIGSGQPSRLDSCQIAINKMKKFINSPSNIIAASDAFFPFIDGIEKLVQAGVKAVIQPAGSIKDKAIIKFANETNTVLVFSKTRHFNH